jgi:N-glycosylase/DNA lyase
VTRARRSGGGDPPPTAARPGVLSVAAPPGFRFAAVVAAHGWRSLAPYEHADDAPDVLRTVWRLDDGPPVALVFRDGGAVVRVRPSRPLTPGARSVLRARTAYAFAFDVDLSGFHALCRRTPRLRWVARGGYGRFLRGGDLFEDALKTLLTTNCTWSQTVAMTARLVAACGVPTPDGAARAFPTPEAVLAAGAAGLDRDVRLGYRTRGALELAERAARGDLEPLLAEPAAAARKRIRGWYGFGPYAADSLLQVLGRNDEIVVDSWALAQARRELFGGRRASPAAIRKHYAPYGAEAPRAAWFDLNRAYFGAG